VQVEMVVKSPIGDAVSEKVIIRELFGLEQMMTIFPLYSEVSHLSDDAIRVRLSAMLAQNNYRCIAAIHR